MARNHRAKKVPPGKRRRNSNGHSATTARHGHNGRTATRTTKHQSLELEDELIALLYSKGGQAVRKEIFAELPLASRGKRKILDNTLQALCHGKTLSCKGELFRLSNIADLVAATISSNPKGFAFARPVTELKDTRENDIFIPPGATGTANHGDQALIRLTKARRDKREGRVIKVLQRATTRIVGTFQANGLVVPEDERFTYNIRISPQNTAGAKDGEIVVAEITDFSSGLHSPTGQIIKILGNSDDPSVQADIVINLHELPHQFSQETINQVQQLDGTIKLEPGRVDLRDIPHVTIDSETARDFDDAVAIQKIGKNFRLHVSIADVSHYVAPGSALDQDAYQRGTSVYFPGRVVPMLPERLSNDLCSLVPDQDRLAFTAILDFDLEGKLIKKSFTKSIIRSHQRFTYNIVYAILSAAPVAEIRKKYKPFNDDLETMAALADILQQKRVGRGSIGFEIPEPEINLGDDGHIRDISRSQRNQAHRLIEEFMLAANEAVAGAFSELDQPGKFAFLYRIHEKPDALKVEDFVSFAKSIGIPLPEMANTPHWFAGIIDAVKGSPKEYIISNLLLRTMQQARYAPDNVGHFGLAASDYCHFTSPIRRYPDLMVHRALQQLLGHDKSSPRPQTCFSSAEEAGLFLSGRERVAVTAERELIERLQVRYMADHLGEEYDGIVSGVASFGIFIELLDSFISGAMPIEDLTGDHYEIDDKNHRVIGRNSGRIIQIGDQIRVKVNEVNIRRRRINFCLSDS